MAMRNVSKLVRVDDDNKIVLCDMDNATAGAVNTVQMYITLGYELNPKRVSGDTKKKEDYVNMCKTKEQREKFDAICKGTETVDGKKGFFAAKKWLLAELEK